LLPNYRKVVLRLSLVDENYRPQHLDNHMMTQLALLKATVYL
jgi:hypothetical protein